MTLWLSLFLAWLGPVSSPAVQPAPAAAGDYPIRPVAFTSVRVSDRFWAPRIRRNHDVTIPIAIGHCYRTGRVDNFRIAAEALKGGRGKYLTEFPFDDTDLYKIIEGASFSLQTYPDPALEGRIDSLIAFIASAQEPDGYLYTSRTIDPEHPHPWASKVRWEGDPGGSHELYNCGHLYEAAAAHFQATGKRTLLDVALKNADLLLRDFGPGRLSWYPGHQVVEMGLVKLYRLTGKTEYLDLARFFLDCRRNGGEYNQSHLPVTEQTRAVGHAVRATYMYAGMADVAALTGAPGYLNALDAIWGDLMESKIYLTGGIGAAAGIEGFSAAYELPNLSAYNETCASIGEVYWNHRMFLLTGDGRYMDVLERVLYNGVLSGVSLSGDRFFYPNPLEARGGYGRSEWFGCACCPGNVCRLIPSVPGYAVAAAGRKLYVNLYIAGTASVEMENGTVEVTQETDYPWDGSVSVSLHPRGTGRFAVALRVPGWAREEVLPGNLYRFTEPDPAAWTLTVNGKSARPAMEKGYAVVEREWRAGDRIRLVLPMPVRRVIADSRVAADAGHAALQRGPLVYCAESADLGTGRIRGLVLERGRTPVPAFRGDLLDGVVALNGRAAGFAKRRDGSVSRTEIAFTAVPYYAWANRGAGEMAVWLAESPSALRLPDSTIAFTSRVLASRETASLGALNDQDEPSRSHDPNVRAYDWWPLRDTTQWVAYEFGRTETVRRVRVFWYDDGPSGGCRIPDSWTVSVRDTAGAWRIVSGPSPLASEKDAWNACEFGPAAADAVRLDVRLPKEHSSGILEWAVE